MDPFSEDRTELTGSLISMEFGFGGRIVQLWAGDPALPDEGEDFQFVLPPLTFGEENTEDLLPGTILLSARTDPNSPWISSRNSLQTRVRENDDDYDSSQVVFDYDFPLLPELEVVGRYVEVPGPIPQISWEVSIKNIGRKVTEIGELGFPLAFNNFYDGFGWTDDQLKRLWASRLYIHKFIGGAASYIFAQRMTADPPGLLVFPGGSTGWEFFTQVPGTLNTPHQWEGIPVVYVHSRATIEREGWSDWWNQHTALILEPGDSRTFEMRFVSCDSDKQDGVTQTLAMCQRPAIRLLPSAVAPIDVGVGIEIQGTVPKRFYVTKDAEIETDADEEGGFAFVRPRENGPVRISFEDSEGRISHVHLMFTDPIDQLIVRRANWIAQNQVCRNPASPLHGGLLLTNYATGEIVTDPEEYAGSSGVECSLADALFLAEKNTLYPDPQEIKTLDAYITNFLRDDIQNPGDSTVGSVLDLAGGVGAYVGRPITYPSVYNLYHAMYRVASTFGGTAEKARTYLGWSADTAIAMFRHGWRHYVRTVGILGYARIYEILDDMRAEGMTERAAELDALVRNKARQLVKQAYPYAGESVLDTSGFEEVFAAALFLDNDEHLERTMRCAFAARSLSPSWWWYGSDKRSWDGADSAPLRALIDRGEACLSHTTIPTSSIFFAQLDRDYLGIPDGYMRKAFGGMIGPWALVRGDGAASMCYCPDASSKHSGYNPFTGASGLGYFHYLRCAGSYVLPNRSAGTYTFGCHFEQDGDEYIVRPWDGVGRRIILRQIEAEFELGFGRIEKLTLDLRKRSATLEILNPANKVIRTSLRVYGMWGTKLKIGNQTVDNGPEGARATFDLPASRRTIITVKVMR